MTTPTPNAASEREMFEEWWISGGPNTTSTYDAALSAWQAARRTPAADSAVRDQVIEECAKLCEMERDALRKNEAVWDANPTLRPDEEYISEWESSACRGEEYAVAIRALKAAPTTKDEVNRD